MDKCGVREGAEMERNHLHPQVLGTIACDALPEKRVPICDEGEGLGGFRSVCVWGLWVNAVSIVSIVTLSFEFYVSQGLSIFFVALSFV